jgi:hypothetical protein
MNLPVLLQSISRGVQALKYGIPCHGASSIRHCHTNVPVPFTEPV